jgi:hypothetical protein
MFYTALSHLWIAMLPLTNLMTIAFPHEGRGMNMRVHSSKRDSV